MRKIAYLDCFSGISGDMMLGALVDCGVELAALQQGIDSLGLPDCRLQTRTVQKKGFRAVKVDVLYEPEHRHRGLQHIAEMIDRSGLADRPKSLAKRIFTRLAEAEARVHGTTVDKVHFHEVGAVDSIADIVGAAVGLDLLGVGRVVCSPIPTGCGSVRIAHGRVSVPAPATAELLKGVPLAPCSIEAELTTPTGAAIATTVADEFGAPPAMRIDVIGCGAGSRDLDERPNLLRMLLGQPIEARDADQVWILETNLDDVSGELIGHATERLLEAGALDVYTTAIQMKKNRPGVTLSVICHEGDVGRLEEIIFRETTTLGVRRWPASRHKLRRAAHRVETPFGTIEGKLAFRGEGQARFAPEYESCRSAAARHGVPLKEIYEAAQRAFETERAGNASS